MLQVTVQGLEVLCRYSTAKVSFGVRYSTSLATAQLVQLAVATEYETSKGSLENFVVYK